MATTGEVCVADGIDASVDGVQPAAFEPAVDRPATKPESAQLHTSDDAVLALRETRQRPVPIDRGILFIYVLIK
jgi:hypothetical protein